MRFLLSASLLFLSALALGQQPCPVPPSLGSVSHSVDMFTDQQEVDLGDAMAEQITQRTKIIGDEKLAAYLQALGDRIIEHLPENKMRFRFYLVDLPEVNAFSIAGGRVYVARKLVALAQNDDELAGVLAHELGHILTHQSAIYTTRRFQEVLGVTAVKDRADIFDKYHLYVENHARKPSRSRGPNEDKDQGIADQVALYAMARAGYAPHAFVDFWDRFQQTHGKTGTWFSELFGSTKPSEQRLREMLKDVHALPAGCADIPPSSRSAEFTKWQAEVINYSGTGSKESLPGLESKQTLAQPLRPDISYVHFSPDGKYALAQDEGGIHVLTRDPFAVLFYIPAVEAQRASFSPDSRSIVFHNRAMRVEIWSIADQKQTAVHELTIAQSCIQSALSPDASTAACLNGMFELSLIDVPSGAAVVTKKKFLELNIYDFVRMFAIFKNPDSAQLITMGFSPDGKYFLARSHVNHFAFDVVNRREINLPGSIQGIVGFSFAFVGPDRIIGVSETSPDKSPLLRFPSGERLDQYRLNNTAHLDSVGHGDYVLVHPLKGFAIGILDLKTQEVPAAIKESTLDIYDDTLLRERMNGEISLEDLSTKKTLARIQLPQARLGPLRAAAVSPDLDWLALSTRSRGGLYDVVHNTRTQHLRGFQAAWFGDDGNFYLDIDEFDQTPRTIVRLAPLPGGGQEQRKLGEAIAEQHGKYLVLTNPKNKNPFLRVSDADVEVRDIRNDHVVWMRHFPHEVPSFSFSEDRMMLTWPLGAGGEDEIRQFPELKAHAEKNDYLCEILDPVKNTVSGSLLIKTNRRSFRLASVSLAGDWAIVTASGDQVLTYSVASGQENAHFFGRNPVASSATGLLAFDSEASRVKLYDLATSQLRYEYEFPEPVAMKMFSADGKRMLVLTVGQTVYVLDVTAKI
jgi:hypothetical protein